MFSKETQRSLFALIIFFPALAWSSFYQADTMLGYCKQYIKFIELKSSVNQLEAGVCSGYIASAIEIMDLSDRLCQRESLNLDKVIKQYIEHVENNEEVKKYTATFALVDLLQQKYSCSEK